MFIASQVPKMVTCPFIRDFKRHTASKILKEIKESTESRKDWMIKRFEFAAKSHKRNSELQF